MMARRRIRLGRSDAAEGLVDRRRVAAAIALFTGGLALGACKIVATPKKQTAGADEGGDSSFDPNAMVRAIWDPKVIPYLTARAQGVAEVVAAAKANPDDAGQKYGYRAKEGSEPWTFAVKISGRIVAAETASRAGTVSVDNDGDGKVAAIIQIGPAMRGTALRDALNFVSFNDFKNQIDYAQFGKAFNTYAVQTFLSQLPRDRLVGRSVTALGAFTLEAGDQPPLVTPAQFVLGPPA
jgi:predicted lipoprotein